MARFTTKHPRVVRSLGDGKFMVIDTTMRDPHVDSIFGPVSIRIRERGLEVGRKLKQANTARR